MGLHRIVLLALLASSLACVTYPQGGGSGAGYFGDRTAATLTECVVSVPAGTGVRNLHVALAATVNPRAVSSEHQGSVVDLVLRMETRIDARLLEVLLAEGPIAVTDLPAIRERVAKEAQAVVDQALVGWEHASEWEVRVMIVSLYFTDGSIHRETPGRRWW